MEPSPKAIQRRRTLLRLLLFGLPVVLWMGVIFVGSTTLGKFGNSAYLLQNTLHLLAPDAPMSLDQNGYLIQVNLFILNAALRRLTHIFLFGILTVLIVRWIQGGEMRLKRASLMGAFVVSLLYVGADEWHRAHVPERHAKGLDWLLNLTGVALVIGGTALWFAIKEWERRLLSESEIEEKETHDHSPEANIG